jgi:hypothetical protein
LIKNVSKTDTVLGLLYVRKGEMMKIDLKATIVFVLLATCVIPLAAQNPPPRGSVVAKIRSRPSAPEAKEIAQRFQQVAVQQEETVTATIKGKEIKVTPVVDKTPTSRGTAIAILETQLPGDETNLRPGKYNVYLVNVGGKLHAYAESGGKVTEAASVTVESTSEPIKETVAIFEKGWHFSIKCRKSSGWLPKCKININF